MRLKLLLCLLQALDLQTLLLPLLEPCVPLASYGVRDQFKILSCSLINVISLLESIDVVLLCPYALLLRIVRFYLWSGQAADLPERVGIADG